MLSGIHKADLDLLHTCLILVLEKVSEQFISGKELRLKIHLASNPHSTDEERGPACCRGWVNVIWLFGETPTLSTRPRCWPPENLSPWK